jgi:hypothetical protein
VFGLSRLFLRLLNTLSSLVAVAEVVVHLAVVAQAVIEHQLDLLL